MDGSARYHELKRVSLITILVNLVLAAAKMAVGFIAGSTAVISDGVHSLSDIITTFMVMVGLKLSSKSADGDHPYGHQRIESLFSLALGTALSGTALFLGYEGIIKIMGGTIAALSPLTFIVTISSIAAKEWMFRYTKAKAKKYNSSSMMSDAWHHRTDSISSIAVLIGLTCAYFGARWADPAATIAVCIIILKAAYSIVKSSVEQLIDKAATKDTEQKLRDIVIGNPEVKRIHQLRTRISNNVIFADITIEVDANMTVRQSHEIAQAVRSAVTNSGLSVSDCMVHIHPAGE